MEIKKISFKEKNDVEKQWNPLPFGEAHFNACNYDCDEWFFKNLGTAMAEDEFTYCHTRKTAKTSIWL